jgi:hypothetical protein
MRRVVSALPRLRLIRAERDANILQYGVHGVALMHAIEPADVLAEGAFLFLGDFQFRDRLFNLTEQPLQIARSVNRPAARPYIIFAVLSEMGSSQRCFCARPLEISQPIARPSATRAAAHETPMPVFCW